MIMRAIAVMGPVFIMTPIVSANPAAASHNSRRAWPKLPQSGEGVARSVPTNYNLDPTGPPRSAETTPPPQSRARDGKQHPLTERNPNPVSAERCRDARRSEPPFGHTTRPDYNVALT